MPPDLDTADPVDPPIARARRRVMNLLPSELDVRAWRQAFDAGEVPDRTPYGYHHAEALGYELVYPRWPRPVGRTADALSRLAWRTLGFDLLHVWRNRDQLWHERLDAVWTHTEREFLAFLLLRRLGLVPEVPIVAQSVWLADEWPQLGRGHRMLYDWLMRDADICTFMSPLNETFARDRQWGRRIQLVEFGISLESFPLRAPRRSREPGPIRVLAAGNDRHRDWTLLHQAYAGDPTFEVTVASQNFPATLMGANIAAKSHTQAEMREAYARSDVVVVPLRDHLHASGITVICEAVACGKPVVASRAGGLGHYFTDDHVVYVPVGDASAMASATRRVAEQADVACMRTVAAQRRLLDLELTSAGYARRHVELTDALLAARAETPTPIRRAVATPGRLRTPRAPS